MNNELIKMLEMEPMFKHEFLDTHNSFPWWLKYYIKFKCWFRSN